MTERGGMSGMSLLRQEDIIGYIVGGSILREKKQYFFLNYILLIFENYIHTM